LFARTSDQVIPASTAMLDVAAEERFVHSLAQLPDPWRVYHRPSWYHASTGDVDSGNRSLPDAMEDGLAPFIKAGRAAFGIVLKG
jgi:hypothetical protein